jgi:putative flippase GtrA
MRALRLLVAHPLAGPTIRYGIAGTLVAAVYLGAPLLFNGALGWPLEVAIPVAYTLAVILHFNLQRHFVFRHVQTFALSTRAQIGRYVVMGAIQYPATALSTALLPKLLGLSARATFVCTALAISLTFFLVLRSHVFHPTDEAGSPVP